MPSVGVDGPVLRLRADLRRSDDAAVLFTNFGGPAKHKQGVIKGSIKPIEAADASIFMRHAKSVIIIPGCGLSVAQGQQKLYQFVKLLQAAGVGVKFAVHPVAGRMPGAEVGVPNDLISQLEDINDEFASTDVALVIGPNDMVNLAAPHRQILADLRHADPQRRQC